MTAKRIASMCIAASVAITPAARAVADTGDALLGAVVGGIITGAIVNENNKKRQTTTVVRRSSSGVSSAQREENRQVQTALNYFGFPVGTPDGAIGPKSRAAISDYQMVLGYPPTGQLTEYEKTFLLGSYHRAVAGGPTTMQMAAQNPMGMRGLLVAWQSEAAGGLPPGSAMAAMGGAMPVMPGMAMPGAAMAVMPVVPMTQAPAAEPAPVEAAAPAAPGLPSFMAGDTAQASLASHCNTVSLMTSTNGGFVTAASMADPRQALGEQFCLARTYAIAEGETAAARIQGFTPQQISQQCAGFGPAMAEQIAALSLKPAAEVLASTQAFALSSGMPPAQLTGTAGICLSVGYRTDAMDVAIASALLLTALGEPAYAELLGHHLSQGFGAATRPDLALGWYDIGLGATEAVFAPGQPERTDLIRRAAYTLGGKADALPAPVPAALPNFGAPAAPVPQPAGEDQSSIAPAPGVQQTAAAAVDSPSDTPSDSPVSALPVAAQLPFLLFRN
ncbi:peptidoglycan-binding domain-containing protein [Frigidibacter oleivorans]|uniref:peptidoglycan-binding domain-containing protein n=1 Tax=Frigidibacter oleivorans TaxID=2487129 RepID=UPI000F8EBCED|nr:peptidoglycan-binding domain-containing protein [Frigidibacter oleivorans]